MRNESAEPILSAVFVDYDNVYLSLKRKSEEAAKRFAKDANTWIKAIASGELITPTNSMRSGFDRRLVMNRCYGNPVPRRNTSNNTTDMNSFAFVRHHFLRSGFEIVDCPPLTAQLKNSSDIRMVMDIRDYLDHKTNFDEFIILSSDADFTPVLHRLRSHAKRTVIFANDNTVTPYTALSDGEVREADLISYLLGERIGMDHRAQLPASEETLTARDQIIDQVVQAVLEGDAPVPLEALAERAIRALGHEKTVGCNWAGAGSFRELLVSELPETIKLTGEPPYLAYDASRTLASQPATAHQPLIPQPSPEPAPVMQTAAPEPVAPLQAAPASELEPGPAHGQPLQPEPQAAPLASLAPAQPAAAQAPAPEPMEPLPAQQRPAEPVAQAQPQVQHPPQPSQAAQDLHQSISRIHAACEAPPFSPPEYRALFAVLAQEIGENQLQGIKTLENVARRAAEIGIRVSQADARYVLDAVSEEDPWFEQGATAPLFAARFRNYVVNRCQQHGLNLSVSELDLIDAWFAASPKPEGAPLDTAAMQQGAGQPQAFAQPSPAPELSPASQRPQPAPQQQQGQPGGPDWWRSGTAAPATAQGQFAPAPAAPPQAAHVTLQTTATSPEVEHDDFPRIVRNRLRG
jgi:hypothetical protein